MAIKISHYKDGYKINYNGTTYTAATFDDMINLLGKLEGTSDKQR